MSLPTVRFGDVCNLINGKAFKPEDWSDHGEPIIRIQNLNDASKPFNYWAGSLHRQVLVKPGDVLLAWSGTPGTSFGTHIWRGSPGILNQHIFRVDLDAKRISKEWCVLAVNSRLNRLIEQAHGGVGLKHVTRGMVDDLEIPLPPLREQHRIAAILDLADEVRQKRRQALKRIETLVQSLFIDFFGDPIGNPKNPNIVRLADVTTRITDGVHQKPVYRDDGIPFISVKNITTGVLRFDDCKFVSREDHEKFTKRCRAERGDILYTKVGATYGRPALVDKDLEFSIYVSVCLIKPRNDLIESKFLCTALGLPAVKVQADRRIKGIGVPDLHLDQIREFLIPLPSLSEQREFSAQISAVERVIATQQISLAKLDALFASLQYLAFRGELTFKVAERELAMAG